MIKGSQSISAKLARKTKGGKPSGAPNASAARSAPPPRTVHGHLVDLRGVVLLDVPQDADVVVLHEVDGHTLPAVPPRPPDSLEEAELVGRRRRPDPSDPGLGPRGHAHLWMYSSLLLGRS